MNTGPEDQASSKPPSPPESQVKTVVATPTEKNGEQVVRIVLEGAGSLPRRQWWPRFLTFAQLSSVMLNFALFSAYGTYFSSTEGPIERFHSGSRTAQKKIAVISVTGTIMPPFTSRTIDQIKKAAEDKSVAGVVLAVDSPGGLVADSHQIYHQLTLLAEKKPVFVQMHRIAASGGYYVAMAAGKNGRIFAEPTTWTGSIGVIIPYYDLTNLADKVGVRSEPLTTGEFKDSLSSFKPLSDRERDVWTGILDDSYQRFLSIIEQGRPELSREQVESVATGRVFTADQAKAEGLVDEIGFLEGTIEQLKTRLELSEVRVVEYRSSPTLADILMGQSQARSELSLLQELLKSPSPRAFYLLGNHDWAIQAP